MTTDGAAAMENLWAELAQAKEQARISNAAAEKAVGELKAEQAAHRPSEQKISNMALELRDAASRYELLEKENQEKWLTLRRPYRRQRKPSMRPERLGRRSGKPGRSWLGSPFYCELSSTIQSMPRLIKCGVLRMHIWTCQRVLMMRRSFSRPKKAMKRKLFSGRSLACQGVRCC